MLLHREARFVIVSIQLCRPFRAVSMAIHQPQGLRPGLCCTAPLGLKPLILGYHIQTLLPLISVWRKTALSDCTRREDSP